MAQILNGSEVVDMVLTIPGEPGDSGKTPKWHPDWESAGSNAKIT